VISVKIMLFIFVAWIVMHGKNLMKNRNGCVVCVKPCWMNRAVVLAACVLIAFKTESFLMKLN